MDIIFVIFVIFERSEWAKTYLELCQTSMMKLFRVNSERLKVIN